jgi:hypothetical protein
MFYTSPQSFMVRQGFVCYILCLSLHSVRLHSSLQPLPCLYYSPSLRYAQEARPLGIKRS